MSVRDNYSKAGPYAAYGTQTKFPFSFKIFKPEQVRVFVNAKELDTLDGYSVTVGSENGNVVFDTPPQGDITIMRNMDFEQGVDLQNNTAFLAEVLEDALDKLTMIAQQLRVDLDRAIIIPPNYTGDPEDYYTTILEARTAAVNAANNAANTLQEVYKAYNQFTKDTQAALANMGRIVAQTEEIYGKTVTIYNEIDNYFGGELVALTENLIGETRPSAAYIAQEVTNALP